MPTLRNMGVERLTILGVGLLGGSIGLAAHASIKGCRVAGYGHRRSTLDAALASGAIDIAFDDPAEACQGADLVVLCTPVGLFDDLLRQVGHAIGPTAVVTDVGSTKRSVVRSSQEYDWRERFVGSHPMAGSEKRGVAYARADLFRGALCLLTPFPGTDPDALNTVETFWQAIGMRTVAMSPQEHDRVLADVSHLPHVIAAAMVAMQGEAALQLAGKGFIDSTRIASGDGTLWRDILVDNADNIRLSIQRLKGNLDAFAGLLGKPDELAAWLNQAAARREGMVAQAQERSSEG